MGARVVRSSPVKYLAVVIAMVLAAALSVPAGTGSVMAGGIIQIGSGILPMLDSTSNIDNGQVVWAGSDGNNFQIFLYDGSSTIQLTSDNSDHVDPVIDAGQVVWRGSDGIFLYDGTSTVQLIDNPFYVGRPDIDAGQVVWSGGDGNDSEIFLYDGSSTIQLTNNSVDDVFPLIDAGQVMWGTPCPPGTPYPGCSHLFLYDGTSTIQLADNAESYQALPEVLYQIADGQATWGGSDGEIYLYDGVGVTQLTSTSAHDICPRIDGGQVAWFNYEATFLYDGSHTICLTTGNGTADGGFPRIDSGQVVWAGRSRDSGDYLTWLYDGSDITSLGPVANTPQIDSGQVLWMDPDNNVFLYDPLLGAAQILTATGTGMAYLAPSSGVLEDLTPIGESSLPSEGKPDIEFPHGFFEFEITGLTPGESVTLTITLPSAVPTYAQYWKYGPTFAEPLGEWYQIYMGDNDGDNVITITLTDGGTGDDDLVANGTIVDQGGPGWPWPTGGGGHSAPAYPSIYIGIGAAIAAGILAYFVRRKLAAG